MNESELYKVAENLDEEVFAGDFGEEITEFDNEEFVKLVSDKENNANKKVQKSMQNSKKVQKNENIRKKMQKNNDKFKEQYFSYYDDIKIPSHKIVDW